MTDFLKFLVMLLLHSREGPGTTKIIIILSCMQRGVAFYRLYAKLRREEVRHPRPDFLDFEKSSRISPYHRNIQACSTSHPSGNQVDGLPLVAHLYSFLAVFVLMLFIILYDLHEVFILPR